MTRLSEIAKAQSGVGFPLEYQGIPTGDYPLAKVSDISNAVETNNGIVKTAVHWVSEEIAQQLNANVFPCGSVLFAKIGEALRLNRRGFVVRPVLADNNVMGLIPDTNRIDPKYLYYFMLTVDLAKYAQTTSVPSIRASDVLNIEIPLPPLDEQKRIAAILEEADYARQARSFTQSVSETFLQEVFVEMFGDPVNNPMGWDVIKLGKLLSKSPQNGLYVPADDYVDSDNKSGIEMVHMSDLFYDVVVRGGLKRVRRDFKNLEKYYLSVDDLLIARRSLNYEGAAKPCQIPLSDEPLVFESSMIRITPDKNKILSTYLYHYLANPEARQAHLFKYVTISTISGINQDNLKEIDVIVPHLDIQNKFAQIVHDLENTYEQQQESARQAEHLFETLLHRAFRGEL